MTKFSDKPVIIIGAGISGLALAQGLLKAAIPFRIYERDPVFNVRSQGYRVRLSDDGIRSLKQVLPPLLYSRLEDGCAQFVGAGGAAKANLDATTAEDLPRRLNPPKQEFQPLNADRTVLRNVLIQGLEQYVEFGKAFAKYEVDQDGGDVTVRFEDGSEVAGRLLVAADGARSRVKRQLLPQEKLLDTEGRLIYGKTTLTPDLESQFTQKAMHGMVIISSAPSSHPTNLFLEAIRFKANEYRSQLPSDYIYWVLMCRKGSTTLNEIHPSDETLLKLSPDESADLANQLTKDWHPSIRPLFELQDRSQTAVLRILSADPKIARWDCAGKITLIGDAAHVMSPTAGIGATTALRDAAVLASALAGADLSTKGEGQEVAVRGYEEEMRVYAEEAVKGGQRGGKMLFGMPEFEQMEAVI